MTNAATHGPRAPSLTVRQLVADPGLGVELTVVAGESGLDRPVRHARIQKSGLALVGHFHGIVPTRIQILGQTELSFLQRQSRDERRAGLEGFMRLGLSCVVMTQGKASFSTESDPDATGEGALPVPELIEAAAASGTPLLAAEARSSATISALHAVLDDRLAPRSRLHGVLVDVFGVGLLLMGPSAIGKSESALDLVMRGHRLVADDVVECDYRPPGMVFGAPAEMLRHHLEVRGLGILNAKDLFGVAAVRERKRVDVVVKLVEWTKDVEFDRMGVDERHHEILGVKIPELVIPVRPGRDMASILEVAARNELLKNAGHHAAREFFSTIDGRVNAMSERAGDESAAPPPVAPLAPFASIAALAARRSPRAPESSATLPRTRPDESTTPRRPR
jgi:HPr kinase/phosphorylase